MWLFYTGPSHGKHVTHFLSPWILDLIYFFRDWVLPIITAISTQPHLPPHILSLLSPPASRFLTLSRAAHAFNSLHPHPLLIHSLQLLLTTQLKRCFLCGSEGVNGSPPHCAVIPLDYLTVTTTKASFLAFCSYAQVSYPLTYRLHCPVVSSDESVNKQ